MEKVIDNKVDKKEDKTNNPKSGGKDSSFRRRNKRRDKTRSAPEFEKRVLTVRRVVRVVAGGRRFSFSAVLAIGDKKGRVGLGIGKSNDTTIALDKAFNDAKKNLIKIPLTEDGGISHDVQAKYCASVIALRPTDKGLVAGGVVRIIAELAGIKKVGAKILSRSKSHINNARATLLALSQLNK